MSGTPLRKALSALLAASLLIALPAQAANVCDPDAGGDCVDVDPTAGMFTFEHDSRGNGVGQKRTYTASTINAVATAAGTGPFFSICGSASTTLRVLEVQITGAVATAATRSAIALTKTSTSTSAGTATALTQVPQDSGSAAGTAGLVNYYTALATTGTSAGVVGVRYRTFPITATIAATDRMDPLVWSWGEGGSRSGEGLVLRGTSQCLQAAFPTTTTNAPTLAVSVMWTEE